MASSNPVFSEERFKAVRAPATAGEAMTMEGTVNKAAILVLAAIAGAVAPWQAILSGGDASTWTWYGLTAALLGLGVAFVTIWRQQWAGVTAPVYAVLQGVALGGISATVERLYPGISLQAVSLTIGVLTVMLLAYRAGLLRATEGFTKGVIAATGGVVLLYLVTLGLGLFGIAVPFLHQGGFIGIAISAVIAGIAAMNLILDFDFIETSVAEGAPRYMEWYAAFGLIVTLLWLYIELLKLAVHIAASGDD